MKSLRQDIDNLVCSSGSFNDYNHNELYVHVSLLFSSLIVHGTVTDDLYFSKMISVSKGKNSSMTSSSNYGAITLSSIFGKLFNYIVWNRYSDFISSVH